MPILSGLYTLIISPLELLFEVVFMIAKRIIGNPGFAIVFLSIAVNFLVLPLYKRADELQAEERDIQAKMAYRIKRIKSTFKGDERFFMLQEYYRINHYKPIYALNSSASLLLQIPFFIAAYRFLSGAQCLQGMPFGFITDLGKEDATFMIGSFPVNILPVLMTLINIVSGIIYTKGHPLKSKIQVYGLAVVFLVLLYHSPSGLVFYWLLNNVFSLIKNIISKLKEPKKVLNIILAVSGIAILILTAIKPDIILREKILLAIGSLLLTVPFISGFIKRKPDAKPAENKKIMFILGTLLMALITGLLIPATVINASAEEFINVIDPSSPALYVVHSMLLSFGSWVIWGGVFYFFMSSRSKALFDKAIWMISGISIVNYMLFGTNLGTLSSTLQYDNQPLFRLNDYLINAAVVIAIGGALYFAAAKFPKIAQSILAVGILTVAGIGIYNTSRIVKTYKEYQARAEASKAPSIPLSRNGQNVVVLMMDRAIGDLVPYIMNEKPELQKQFDGFTYYPNTISYGIHTNMAAPALFGGYDYTPENINKRTSELLKDKHNESLKVMPVLFRNNGYKVTVVDPPFANYKVIPDLSIYDDYPDLNCYITNGHFNMTGENNIISSDISDRIDEVRNRSFFFYSLMKISPVALQETIYDGGIYNRSATNSRRINGTYETSALSQNTSGLSKSTGYDLDFLEAYGFLSDLPGITSVDDNSDNTFLMLTNKTAHSPCLLQEPDYVPSYIVDNTAYDVDMTSRYTVNGKTIQMNDLMQVYHYHVNMAAFLKLGEWFDYLRENGVYDNTRIILVADHGYSTEYFKLTCNRKNMAGLLPLLMVKDFNAKGFTVSEDFMTNADTPTLATKGIIKDPVNPFTGNPIDSKMKTGPQKVFVSDNYLTSENNGYTFIKDSWFTVSGDPHDYKSWKYSGEE